MTQSSVNTNEHGVSNAVPVSKIGETGDTVVYIFPDGNAHVKKGKKPNQHQAEETATPHSIADHLNRVDLEEINIPQVNRPIINRTTADYAPKTFKIETDPTNNTPRSGHQKRMKIGEALVEAGLITTNQLQVALYDQQFMGLPLGDVLVARGWVNKESVEEIAEFLKKDSHPLPNAM